MKTVRNNNTAQILWENLCTRSVVPFFFLVSLSRIQLSELLTSLYSCFLLHVTPALVRQNVCFLFCVFCAFVLFYVLLLLLYLSISFLFLYKFTDRCHRVETQLQ